MPSWFTILIVLEVGVQLIFEGSVKNWFGLGRRLRGRGPANIRRVGRVARALHSAQLSRDVLGAHVGDQNSASWNLIQSWLQQVDWLRF